MGRRGTGSRRVALNPLQYDDLHHPKRLCVPRRLLVFRFLTRMALSWM
jgi:hypothetical protein